MLAQAKENGLRALSHRIEIELHNQFITQQNKANRPNKLYYELYFFVNTMDSEIRDLNISVFDIRRLALSKLEHCASLVGSSYYICLFERKDLSGAGCYEYIIKKNEKKIKQVNIDLKKDPTVTILESCYKTPYYNEDYWS